MHPWENSYVVVLAGGVGSRFWPLSRARRPKQLLDLFGDGTLLRVTVDRLRKHVPIERHLVVAGEILGEPIRAALPDLPPENLLLEPVGRNSAPAIGWAAFALRRRDPNALLAVLPADHRIGDLDVYERAVRRALLAASEGNIATLGIRPTRPETGYGYIQAGEQLADGAFRVARFAEKPNRATAERYLAEGGYFWNAGMFFLSARTALAELERYEPELFAGLSALDCDAPDPVAVFGRLKSISIDYAIAERSERMVVVPGDFSWSDVGSWGELFEYRGEAASFHHGDVLEIDGSGNVLLGDGGIVVALGVRDLIIVHTADATLVCRRDEAQRVREVVDAIRAKGREDLL